MPIVGSFAGASARAYGLGAGGVQIGDLYRNGGFVIVRIS